MSIDCRLIPQATFDGVTNMAIDEAILDQTLAGNSAPATLRWYRWSRPTLSLGYFQEWQERPPQLAELPCVRRITGGGAILHDRELTYSLVFAPGRWPDPDFRQMVRQFHTLVTTSLISTLPPELSPGKSSSGGEPFLCFERRSEGDVVLGGSKILGSAQRNRRGALLQHGSILIERSDATPQLPGLTDEGASLPEAGLAETLTERLASLWDLRVEPGPLTDDERERAEEFRLGKYAHPEWTESRRHPR
ncbi:Octanoyltransferase LipM [Planctomycetes bacterium Pan216]|uniref:Octanoyltransferase LipM n=1 Tax=Kolteria novifilia TaxID=2527975 RepID=A0A518AXL3_9BACT|nr:Octanoyltransferase LipM [Planctomycetes bacterium Pan216]